MDIIRFYLPVDSLVKSTYFKTKGMLLLTHIQNIYHIYVHIYAHIVHIDIFTYTKRQRDFKMRNSRKIFQKQPADELLCICKNVGTPTYLV